MVNKIYTEKGRQSDRNFGLFSWLIGIMLGAVGLWFADWKTVCLVLGFHLCMDGKLLLRKANGWYKQ